MMELAGQVALVTGGSRGLGASIVRQLSQEGADVAFTYRERRPAAVALAKEVERLGRRSLAIQADVQNFQRAQRAVAEVVKRLGGLHLVICNAGMARSVALRRMSEADWDEVMDVSLKGTFNYLRAAADHLIRQRAGKIVCIGSINGLRGRVGTASYNTAKAGLIGLVKTAAAEWGKCNINVNLVAPGFIETPSQAHTPELIRELVLKECAIKRLGTPDDIASVVVFLCSDAASHVTGQVITADAGQSL